MGPLLSQWLGRGLWKWYLMAWIWWEKRHIFPLTPIHLCEKDNPTQSHFHLWLNSPTLCRWWGASVFLWSLNHLGHSTEGNGPGVTLAFWNNITRGCGHDSLANHGKAWGSWYCWRLSLNCAWAKAWCRWIGRVIHESCYMAILVCRTRFWADFFAGSVGDS